MNSLSSYSNERMDPDWSLKYHIYADFLRMARKSETKEDFEAPYSIMRVLYPYRWSRRSMKPSYGSRWGTLNWFGINFFRMALENGGWELKSKPSLLWWGPFWTSPRWCSMSWTLLLSSSSYWDFSSLKKQVEMESSVEKELLNGAFSLKLRLEEDWAIIMGERRECRWGADLELWE